MTLELLALAGEGSLDAARVGGKAARLAAGLRAGLPVLPGLVLPVGADGGVIAAAAAQVATAGVHAARFAVMGSETPDLTGVGDELGALGDDLVVRSSSPLEDDPAFSGVFTSYVGVTPAEVATAIRGVWASGLVDPATTSPSGRAPGMAVLVQPRVDPSVSGTAQLVDGDTVSILAVRGEPAPLLSGWARGDGAVVDPTGGASGPALALAGADVVGSVATLMRAVHQALGDDLIEWAATGDGVVLLQSKRAAVRAPAPATNPGHQGQRPVAPATAGIARLVHAFAGALGEELLLPVLLPGAGPASTRPDLPMPPPSAPPPTPAAAAQAWIAAQAGARTLRARAWRSGESGPAAVLADLRAGDVDAALDRLASAAPADPGQLAALLVPLGTVVAWLISAGAIEGPDEMWSMTASDMALALASDTPAASRQKRREARRRALLRWEPFLYTTVAATGSALLGEGVSPGSGAGQAVVVRGLPTDAAHVPRMVVVAPHPIPQLAPLLWGAAGLVTSGGSAAAHLVEVARSRGVPAVIGCDDAQLFSLVGDGGTGPLVAVDGDAGRVAIDAAAG